LFLAGGKKPEGTTEQAEMEQRENALGCDSNFERYGICTAYDSRAIKG
jgi:hypothetical protein